MSLFIDPAELDLIPLLFLFAVYGYILFNASNFISDGSELLLLVPAYAGVVGKYYPIPYHILFFNSYLFFHVPYLC